MDFAPSDRAPINLHVNGAYLPGTYLGFAYYGRATAMKATRARTDFWVLLPLEQPFAVTIDGRRHVPCGGGCGAVLSPGYENLISADGACGRLVLSLTTDAVQR